MRKIFVAFLLTVFCVLPGRAFCISQGSVEFDLDSRKVKLVEFSFGEYKVSGDFSFSLSEDNSSVVFNLEGEGIRFNGKDFAYLEMKLTKRGDVVFVDYFRLRDFNAEGAIDLEKNQVTLNVNGKWRQKSENLEGMAKLEFKVWGALNDFLTSGRLIMEEGAYNKNDFLELSIDFLGKPPLLNITDSKIVLEDGSVLEMTGVMDLRNSSELIPNAEFIVQKVFIDEWQLFSEDNKNVGLKKDINEKFNVRVNAKKKENSPSGGPETELTYNWNEGNFLKLKKEEGGTMVGFERRSDF